MITKPAWFFFLCIAVALRADDTATKLDTMTREFVELGLFRGAVLVVRKDQVLLDRGYGPADAEHGVANSPVTQFRIGSITKWFTLAAIMDLAAEGRLALDASITDFLPEAPASWAPIRVSHLIMHTSGLINFTDLPEFREYRTKSLTPVALLELFKARPLSLQPGEKFNYSNSNYVLLGLVIERITGEEYGAYLQRRYFTPFGLKDTAYPATNDLAAGMAVGYIPAAGGAVPAELWHPSTAYAAGGLVSSTGDLRRWFEVIAAGKVGKPEDWTTLKVERVDYREGGLMNTWAHGRNILAMSGLIPGFVSNLAYDITSGTLVIVLANISGVGGEDLIKNLVAIVQGGSPELPSTKKGIAVPVEILARYAGTYQMAAGFALTVTVVDGRLQVQVPGQAQVELIATAETKFEARALQGNIEFVRDEQGVTVQVVLTRGGRKIPGTPLR